MTMQISRRALLGALAATPALLVTGSPLPGAISPWALPPVPWSLEMAGFLPDGGAKLWTRNLAMTLFGDTYECLDPCFVAMGPDGARVEDMKLVSPFGRHEMNWGGPLVLTGGDVTICGITMIVQA